MKKSLFFVLVVLFIFNASISLAAKSDASLKAILDQATSAHGLIGAVCMVSSPTGTIYKAASGVADMQAGTPMATEMHFRVASVSKMFTAAICLKLQQEGILDLDDPITRWFPATTIPNASIITLRHLLAMRAGLSDFPNDLAVQFRMNPILEWSEPLAATQAVVLEVPGTTYRYINRNSVLANLICAQATGKSYRQLLNEYVLTPYTLNNTFIPFDASLPVEYAKMYGFYDMMGNPTPVPTDITEIQRGSYGLGASGTVSNATDLIVWLNVLFGGEFLNAASIAQMKTFQDGDGSDLYGLGCKEMGDAIGHDGSFLAAHTSVAVTVGGYKLVILANGCMLNNNTTTRTIMQTIIDEFGLTESTTVPTVLTPLLLTN